MNRTSSIIRSSQALAVAALLPALAGCEERTTVDGQLGELGRLEFTYTRSCLFGCLVQQPLLAGTRETIKLEGDGASQPNLSVRAVHEDVAQVALDRQCYCEREDTTGRLDVALDGLCEEPWHMVCENKILIEAALEPGETPIEVRDDGDQLLDRVTVRVEEADRARFFGTLPDELGEEAGDQFSLPAQSRLELRIELYDDGIELLAPEGVTWRVSDPSIATLNAFLIGSGEEVSAGRDIVVETHAAGEASVEIDVPGLQAAIDVEVE